MATLTIKTTYSLDPETVRRIEALANRWGVSRSETIRRSVQLAAAEPAGGEALAALDQIQRRLALTPIKARAWAKTVRDERQATRRGSAR